MRFHQLIIAAFALGCQLLPCAEAFTNGTMLPKYLCGPAIPQASGAIVGADGFPKALAGVLGQMRELSPGVQGAGYNAMVDPRLWVAVMHAANSQGFINKFAVVNGNTGANPFVEAALNSTAAKTQGGIMTAAQFNILHVGKQLTPPTPAQATTQAAAVGCTTIAPENVIPTATGTNITPNQLVTLTLQSQNNILGAPVGGLALNATAFAALAHTPVLDGAIVYANDVNNNRVGHFPTGGNSMAVWAACGPDRNGVVHNQLLSPCTNTYTGPTFFLPFDFTWVLVPNKVAGKPPVTKNNGPTNITFLGAAVSDNGFGYHQTKWQVQTLPDFPVDPNALDEWDMDACMSVQRACMASCYDCILQAGSKKKVTQVRTIATLTCLSNPAAGDPMLGQATVWNATCTINGKVTPVVPAGTLAVYQAPPTTKDATGNDMPLSAADQAMLDAFNAANMPDTIAPTNAAPCPTSNTQNAANTATSHHAHSSWFTIITVALSAVLAARQ